MNKSGYLFCPWCHNPLELTLKKEGESIIYSVWCGHAKCPSLVANRGVDSTENFLSAYTALLSLKEEEGEKSASS